MAASRAATAADKRISAKIERQDDASIVSQALDQHVVRLRLAAENEMICPLFKKCRAASASDKAVVDPDIQLRNAEPDTRQRRFGIALRSIALRSAT